MIKDRINAVYARHMFNLITPSSIRGLYQALNRKLSDLKSNKEIKDYNIRWNPSTQAMEVRYSEMAQIESVNIKLTFI